MKKQPFRFGLDSLMEDYIKTKQTIQCPHIYKTIKLSTMYNASRYVSFKWNKFVDYKAILEYVGVKIVED